MGASTNHLAGGFNSLGFLMDASVVHGGDDYCSWCPITRLSMVNACLCCI